MSFVLARLVLSVCRSLSLSAFYNVLVRLFLSGDICCLVDLLRLGLVSCVCLVLWDSSFQWLGCPFGGVLPLQFTWLVVPPAGVSSGNTCATRCGLLVICLPPCCVKTVPYSGTYFLPCKGKPHCVRRFAPLHSRKQVHGLLALKHSTGGYISCSIKSL